MQWGSSAASAGEGWHNQPRAFSNLVTQGLGSPAGDRSYSRARHRIILRMIFLSLSKVFNISQMLASFMQSSNPAPPHSSVARHPFTSVSPSGPSDGSCCKCCKVVKKPAANKADWHDALIKHDVRKDKNKFHIFPQIKAVSWVKSQCQCTIRES